MHPTRLLLALSAAALLLTSACGGAQPGAVRTVTVSASPAVTSPPPPASSAAPVPSVSAVVLPPELSIRDLPQRFIEKGHYDGSSLSSCHGLAISQRYSESYSAGYFQAPAGSEDFEAVTYNTVKATDPSLWDRIVADIRHCSAGAKTTTDNGGVVRDYPVVIGGPAVGDDVLWLRVTEKLGDSPETQTQYWSLVKSGDYVIQLQHSKAFSNIDSPKDIYRWTRAAVD